MRTDLFDFELPEHLIALEPATPRDSARMLVVHESNGAVGVRPRQAELPQNTDGSAAGADPKFADRIVRELPDLLRAGDVLVLNDTRVLPAALDGVRIRGPNRAHVAFNLTKRVDDSRWRAFARPAKRLAPGDRVRFGETGRVCLAGTLDAHVEERGDAGEVTLRFDLSGAYLDDAIAAIGEMPLPPYIALKRAPRASDRDSYQTIYAARDGAVAAPTAGLHFTPELFARLDAAGIGRAFVTLHVGAGTFLPVKADDTADHIMHSEWAEIDAATADRLNAARANGHRIVAVGTTSLRVLESAASPDGVIQPYRGETDIFITPGYSFRAVDALLTNFHLPRSTLFMLVSAFAGRERMHAAYAHAIATGYRFYSYGDACLLMRTSASAHRAGLRSNPPVPT